jgi:hypothetical protein
MRKLAQGIADWLFDQIFIRRASVVPAPRTEREVRVRRTDYEPIVITADCIKVNPATIERLEALRMQAVAINDRLMAMADEACALCGFDPESDDCPGEIAKDIVYSMFSVDEVVDHIADIMRMRAAAAKEAGELDQ